MTEAVGPRVIEISKITLPPEHKDEVRTEVARISRELDITSFSPHVLARYRTPEAYQGYLMSRLLLGPVDVLAVSESLLSALTLNLYDPGNFELACVNVYNILNPEDIIDPKKFGSTMRLVVPQAHKQNR